MAEERRMDRKEYDRIGNELVEALASEVPLVCWRSRPFHEVWIYLEEPPDRLWIDATLIINDRRLLHTGEISIQVLQSSSVEGIAKIHVGAVLASLVDAIHKWRPEEGVS